MSYYFDKLLEIIKKIIEITYGKLFPERFAKLIGVNVGKNCRLINVKFSSEPYLIKIGNHVSATSTRFETHDGAVWCFRDRNPKIDIIKPIVIGNNVFIGYGCIILPGVTIGDNTIIGAGSIVSRDIPSNSVAIGIPARVIRNLEEYIFKAEIIGESTKHFSQKRKKDFYKNKFK